MRTWLLGLLVLGSAGCLSFRDDGRYKCAPGETDCASGPPCGMKDDQQVHLAADYRTFVAPTLGAASSDADYGCVITRLTQGGDHGAAVTSGGTTNRTHVNADGTLVLVHATSPADEQRLYVVDRTGAVVVDPVLLSVGDYVDTRWSPTNPRVFYYFLGNTLLAYDVDAHKPTSKVTLSTPEDAALASEFSADGDHLLFLQQNPAGGTWLQVLTVSTGAVSPRLDIGPNATDWVDFTPEGQVAVGWNHGGTDPQTGVELYDPQLTFVKQLVPFYVEPPAFVHDGANTVMVYNNAGDPDPVCAGTRTGIQSISLEDGRTRCLLSHGEEMFTQLNALRSGAMDALVVSLRDLRNDAAGTALPNPQLAADFETHWRPYENELVFLRADGSQTYRLAHHRNRLPAADDIYVAPPFPGLSRDGRVLVFSSGFGAPQPAPGQPYTDVYALELH